MNVSQPYAGQRTAVTVAVAIGLAVAVSVLFVFDPSTAGFFPVCPLHEMTGLQCPGCGGLRAVHQLTHGHLAAAWRLNPFVIALLPVAFWLELREAVWIFTRREWPGLVNRPIFGLLLAGALIVFGILRNLPLHT